MSTRADDATPEQEPAIAPALELQIVRIFEREMSAYISMLEQMGVRLARLERRVHQLEGAHHD